MAPAMIHASASVLAALGNAAARSLVLASFVAAALGAFRARNVRIKLLAWKGLLAVSLAMPVLILLAPAIPLAVPVPNLAEHRAEAAITATTPVPALKPESVSERIAKSAPRGAEQRYADRAQTAVVAGQPAVLAPLAPRRKIPWLLLILGAYAAVALALLARVIVGMRFGRRLVSSAQLVSHAEAQLLLSKTSRAAGLRDDPALRESEALCVPLMLGVLRPAILLPSDWSTWEEGELAAVLAHEVSHVKRNDALAQRLALIHRAIFWFSPLAWWLERQLDELAEQASDEAALAAGADRTRYAETLLGFFSELEAGPERVWWQGVAMAKAGQAEKRVDRILAWRGAMSSQLGKSLVIVLVAVAVPVVALTAAVRLSAYDLQDAPKLMAPPAPPAATADPTPSPSPAQTPAPPVPAQSPVPGDIRITVPALNLPQVTVPPIHIVVPALPALPDLSSMLRELDIYKGFRSGDFAGLYDIGGPRFVIVTKDSDTLTMSGDIEDAEHAKSLRSKITGDFIWFERDGKSYVIRNQATVDRAKKLCEPEDNSNKQREDIGKQREALQKQINETVQKIQETRVKLPDLTADMQKLEETMKKLSAEGGTMAEIGKLQGEMAEMQSRIAEVEASGWLDREQADLARKQGEMGRQIGEFARREAELARQEMDRARESRRELKELLDDAIARGLAKPE
jgi:beta-lactamase regulating signal transducer with metallopeptidase domain